VPRRQLFFIALAALLISVLLLIPSSTIRNLSAVVIVLGTLTWVVIGILRTSSRNDADKQRENAEEQFTLFEPAKLFGATLEGMREGLLVVNRDMQVVASNPAAARLFNPTRGKLESQRLTELTRNPAIYSAFLDALQGKERSNVKVEIHGPERSVFDLRVVPLGMNGSGAEGALGVFFDITRTERLEIVRQEFLSNVSHELRTPLTAILAFVETLESGAKDDPESSQRFLSIIRRNAVRMQGLIDDILELTSIEGGHVTLRIAPTQLRSVVNDVASTLAAKADVHRISINNLVPPDTIVRADVRRLEQMLTNLVDNAIKFNRDDGAVTVRFETNGRDRVIVEDSGEGIPSQHLARLFERFYRIDRARSRDMGGTGLGLAIVKHLALLHGGEVIVTSELGKGTQFSIYLPKLPE
jgi:two-component system, OmpR family, phosphate regulon sensor histidine kinase PhoR